MPAVEPGPDLLRTPWFGFEGADAIGNALVVDCRDRWRISRRCVRAVKECSDIKPSHTRRANGVRCARLLPWSNIDKVHWPQQAWL